MHSKSIRAATALAIAAALALPAGAAAKGHGSESHGKKAPTAKHHGRTKLRVDNYVFVGTVSAVSGNVVTVDVRGGDRRGRKFAGQSVQFDVTGGRVLAEDANGDGKRDASDVAVGDVVIVQSRLPRDGSATQPFPARRLVDLGQPLAPPAGPSDPAQPLT